MPTSDGATLDGIVMLDHEELLVTCYNPDDSIRDITNDRLVFEARINARDELPVISKSTDNVEEIQKTDSINGQAKIYIRPEDTGQFTDKIKLNCRLRMFDALSRVNTIHFKLNIRYNQ